MTDVFRVFNLNIFSKIVSTKNGKTSLCYTIYAFAITVMFSFAFHIDTKMFSRLCFTNWENYCFQKEA